MTAPRPKRAVSLRPRDRPRAFTQTKMKLPVTTPFNPRFERMIDAAGGALSALIVPLLRDGDGIGTIEVTHPGERAFTDRDVKLLQTFADQAVIAIENARLIRELEESNRETTEALEQQTAMSEVLEIISRSTQDEQPVLEEIARQAAGLLGAEIANLCRMDGDVMEYTASSDGPGDRRQNQPPYRSCAHDSWR